MPGTLFFVDSSIKYWFANQPIILIWVVPIEPFVDANLNERVSSSILRSHIYIILPTHSQVILHAGLAPSCRIHILKIKGKSSPLWRRSPAGWMRSLWKFSSPAITYLYWWSNLSWRVWVHSCLWILRLRLRLRAEWQRWEASCEDGRFGIRGTNQKGVCSYGYRFLLMPGTLFFMDSSVECWFANQRCVLNWTVPIEPFADTILNERVSSSILSSHF